MHVDSWTQVIRGVLTVHIYIGRDKSTMEMIIRCNYFPSLQVNSNSAAQCKLGERHNRYNILFEQRL